MGTVFHSAELQAIVDFANQHDLVLISDEIYEALIYDGRRHVSPATLGAARERTVLVNSLSKTYAMTGSRVGYCAAPAIFVRAMLLLLQQFSRGPATFVQDAAVFALESDQECVQQMAAEYQARRDLVIRQLQDIPGIRSLVPDGGLFVMVDLRDCLSNSVASRFTSDDVRRFLLEKHGVVVIHGSAPTAPVAKAFCAFRSRRRRDARTRLGALAGGTLQSSQRPMAGGTRMNAEDARNLESVLVAEIEGEVRFDRISQALYSTDASVYQILPLGVVIPKSREDVIRTVNICRQAGISITARGGGTSQAGQAIGAGVQLDFSKYLHRVMTLEPEALRVRVEPGIVLDELNAFLRPYGLVLPLDISTSDRATIGGMIANNSSGTRSVVYGKTLDYVHSLTAVLSDGSVVELQPLQPYELEAKCARADLEGECYRVVRRLGQEQATEDQAPLSTHFTPRRRL